VAAVSARGAVPRNVGDNQPQSRKAGGNAGLSAFVENGLEECFRSFLARPGAVIDERADLLAVRTGIPLTFCNGVPRTRLGSNAEQRVQETIAWYRAHNVAFRWWLTPSVTPPDLIEILRANRMRHVYYATGMAAELDDLAPVRTVPGLSIVRVEDAAALEAWMDVFAVGFSLNAAAKAAWRDFFPIPRWSLYLGTLDGVAVATSAMCLGPTIGGIYNVVTLPEARGRGVGAAITTAPLLDAAAAGRRIAALQASEMAVSVYRSIGFVECGELELYDWSPQYELD
jgi:ribosomal protein S18 acetylase RimI-like enzyme